MVNSMTYKTKFIFEGTTYFINSLEGNVTYTKLVNNEEVSANEEEVIKVKSSFSSYLDYFIVDYYLAKNKKMDALVKKIIKSVLVKVLEIIPTNYREDFYHNLKTLDVVFQEEKKENFTNKELNHNYAVVALYKSSNTLLINKTYFQKVVSKKDNEEAVTLFKTTIFHELVHMSSAKYTDNYKAVALGFWSVWDGYVNNSIKFTGLVEGYTQLLTSIFNPEDINKTNYSLTSLLMYQLMQIVGKKTLDEAFYKEHSVNNIMQELCRYIPNISLAQYLLETIEKVYQAGIKNTETYCLREAQYVMSKYFKAKIQDMREEKMVKKYDKFCKSLITLEKLDYLGFDKKKYLGIEHTWEDFDKVMKESASLKM